MMMMKKYETSPKITLSLIKRMHAFMESRPGIITETFQAIKHFEDVIHSKEI